MSDIVVIAGIKYVRTSGGALLKHVDHLSDTERAERYGDATYDGEVNRISVEDEIVRRYRAGLPLSISAKREARRIIRASTTERNTK